MFFIIVISLFLSLNSYLFIRGLQALSLNFWGGVLFGVLFFSLSSLLLFRMVKGDNLPLSISRPLSDLAFGWFAALLYLSLFVLSIDIVRLTFKLSPSLSATVATHSPLLSRTLFLVAIVSFAALYYFGNRSFNNPKVTKVTLNLTKESSRECVKIAFISDLHLSSYINEKHLKRWVKLINEQEPNLVLIGGDLIDRNLKPLEQWGAAEILSQIESSDGVFAVAGNHEYYGGERERLKEYLKRGGVELLSDSVAVVAGEIQLIGREDRSYKGRASLETLLKSVDHSKTTLLLDHQPYNLEEAVESKIDVQLSGHTHNGQFWPGNLLVKPLYQLPYGYKKWKESHFYVTSGLGLWGPKIRVGTKSEILLLELNYR